MTTYKITQTGPKTAKATYVPTDSGKDEAPLPKAPSSSTKQQVLHMVGQAQGGMARATLPLGGHKDVLDHVMGMLTRLFGDVHRPSNEPRFAASSVDKPAVKPSPNKAGQAAGPVTPFARDTNVAVLMSFTLFSGNQAFFFACCFVVKAPPSTGPSHRPLELAGPTGLNTKHAEPVVKKAPQAKPKVTQPVTAKAAAKSSSLEIAELIDEKRLVEKRPVEKVLIEDISDEENANEETRPEETLAKERVAEERVVEERSIEERPIEDSRAEPFEVATEASRTPIEPAPEAEPVPAAQPPVAAPVIDPTLTVKVSGVEYAAQSYMEQLRLAETYDRSQLNAAEHRRLAAKEHDEAQRHFQESQRAAEEADHKQDEAQQLRNVDPSNAHADRIAHLEQQAQQFRATAMEHSQRSLDRVNASNLHLEQADFLDQQATQAQQQIQASEPMVTPA